MQIDRARSETYGKSAMVIGTLFLVVMLRVSFITSQWKVADRFYIDFEKVVQSCETGSRLFSAVVNMPYKEAGMVRHLPSFGVIERQLFVPTLFANTMQQPIIYRANMLPVVQQNSPDVTWYGQKRLPCELIKREYDYLLLIDREDDGEAKACGLQRIRK